LATQITKREDGQPRLHAGSFQRCLSNPLDWCDETVAAPMQRLHKSGLIGFIANYGAQPLHGSVKAVLEIDKSSFGPQLAAEFVARQQFAGLAQQHEENVEGLVLKANPQAVLPQLAGADVERKSSKPEPLPNRRHGSVFRYGLRHVST